MPGSNAAIDYEKYDALERARTPQPPIADDFSHLNENGVADNYRQEIYPPIEGNHANRLAEARKNNETMNRTPEDESNWRKTIRNKATEVESYLPEEMKQKLNEIRNDYHDAKKLGGEAKTLAKSLTPWGVFSLISKIHLLTDIPYFFAILTALLKDGLDLVGVGSLPGIGTAVTACSSLFIMAMMFLGNVMHDEHDRTIFQSVILKQFGVLVFTTLVEMIFGLDLAPFETVGVLFIYSFALAARKGRDTVANKNV